MRWESFLIPGGVAAQPFVSQSQTKTLPPNTQNVTVPCDVPYGDLPEYVDFDYVARVGRINLASMWSRAQARGWVQNVPVNASLLSNAGSCTGSRATRLVPLATRSSGDQQMRLFGRTWSAYAASTQSRCL